jgi:hypothetical protein
MGVPCRGAWRAWSAASSDVDEVIGYGALQVGAPPSSEGLPSPGPPPSSSSSSTFAAADDDGDGVGKGGVGDDVLPPSPVFSPKYCPDPFSLCEYGFLTTPRTRLNTNPHPNPNLVPPSPFSDLCPHPSPNDCVPPSPFIQVCKAPPPFLDCIPPVGREV